MKYTFYHVTDTHYYSKKNYDGDPWLLPQWNDQIAMRESEEIIKKAFSIISNDTEAQAVILTGDITHHGDEESCNEMLRILNDTEKYKNVIAFIDSHDYFPGGIRFDKNGKPYPKQATTREKVLPLFTKFNTDKAIDIYKDDFSCVIQLNEKLRFLILSYESSEKGPYISEEYFEWVKLQANKAKHDGCVLIAGIHPPLISPNPAYSIMGKGNIVVNSQEIGQKFAKAGIPLVLCGHSHMQAINCTASSEGGKMFCVSTSSLVGSPPKMRRITFDSSDMTFDIKTITMDLPELNLGMPLVDYCRKGFLGSLEEIPYNMQYDIEKFIETGGGVNLPKKFIKRHKRLVMFLGKKLNNLDFGKLAKLSKKITKLKKREYAEISDKKIVPFIFQVIDGIYSGNRFLKSDSKEYIIIMGCVARLDKIIKFFKIDLNKLTGFSNLKDIVIPLLTNSDIDNDNALLQI